MADLQQLQGSMAGANRSIVDSFQLVLNRLRQMELADAHLTERTAQLESANTRLTKRTEQLETDVVVSQAACKEYELKFADLTADFLDLQKGQSKVDYLQQKMQSLHKKADECELHRKVSEGSLFMLYRITRADYTRLWAKINTIVKENKLRGDDTSIERRLLQNLKALQPDPRHEIDCGCQFNSRVAKDLLRDVLSAGWTNNWSRTHPHGAIWAMVLPRLLGLHGRIEAWYISSLHSTAHQDVNEEIRQFRPIMRLLYNVLRDIIQVYTLQLENGNWKYLLPKPPSPLFKDLETLENAIKEAAEALHTDTKGDPSPVPENEKEGIANDKPVESHGKLELSSQPLHQQDASQFAFEAHLAKMKVREGDGMKPWPKEYPPLWEGGDPAGLGKDRV
ncbi:hypothetical protein I316_02576 [Kwoniella heveanensis BCC8398]|uniref:Uncharacterized protein n=1 Tax=Kwoniella heveanensis BCC8398 TaxID=1296120 RepID=A0A1B9GWX1_9TREE|nr:hypothetical protein I316_02576 [Kwoniella heveanensis BCC8398]